MGVNRISMESGMRIGRWTIIRSLGKVRGNERFECVCDCGKNGAPYRVSLAAGKSLSCGCLQRERVTKHGLWRSSEFKIWQGMRQRCENESDKSYQHYGGRGIKVCDRWLVFENFLADMGKRPGAGYSLDRYPNRDGNYEPSNCRWATAGQQSRNRDATILNQVAVDLLRYMKRRGSRNTDLSWAFGVSGVYIGQIAARHERTEVDYAVS